MKITVLTLFPEVVRTYLGASILGHAAERGEVVFDVRDIRDHAEGKHRQVDDRPFGGGPGMVLMPGPVVAAVEAAAATHAPGAERILLTPQGERLDQRLAAELAGKPGLILVCGRYEGFDERIAEVLNAREISIGDYVLSGGEIPALAVTEAVVRLLPGVLGHADSAQDDSFATGLLEGPQYTRPREFRGLAVPEVLVSGNHAAIDAWRERASEERTRVRRSDLWQEKNDTAFRRKEEPR
ncbi:MAG TPA: tRNA (guanosine(37)-N1)-methyltransferase TrmD [Planctomycetota bacterium]|nr:tRNA (guanosine(37)-N1)-methyltransferase TrmD [Planctomycetota bacterium]